jgi:hypothetical protein
MWIRFIWLRARPIGGLLWIQNSIFGLHKRRPVFLSDGLLDSEELLRSIELQTLQRISEIK